MVHVISYWKYNTGMLSLFVGPLQFKLSIVEKINNSCFCLSCGPSSLPTCDLLAPSLVFHTIACSHVSDH